VTYGGDSGNRIFVLYRRCPLIRGSTVFHYWHFVDRNILQTEFLTVCVFVACVHKRARAHTHTHRLQITCVHIYDYVRMHTCQTQTPKWNQL
jgi:hypothetical protein